MATGRNNNSILEVKKDAACFSLSTNALLHFMLLVSDVEVAEDGTIYSCYRSNVLPANVEKELLDSNNIEIDNGKDVVLGEDKILFTNKVNPLRELQQRIQTEFIQPILNRKRVNVQVVEAANRLTFYMSQPDTIRKPGDAANVFNDAYSVINHNPFGRSFTFKEMGQFKYLFNAYGGTVCVQLILKYMLDAVAPSVGGLLSKKDYIYSKIKGNKAVKGSDENSTTENSSSTGRFL